MPNSREIEQKRPLLITSTGSPKIRAANSHGTGRLHGQRMEMTFQSIASVDVVSLTYHTVTSKMLLPIELETAMSPCP